jgi:RNA polymerase sigma-70 factor (ECF subfamily)
METTGSKLTNLPDTDLVTLAIEQNQAAYIVLYTRYNAGVKSHISRYVAQKEDIEDICLESFQKAFSQIGSYNPE